MKKTDARVSATTESLNNIKMLKLYSWTEAFERSINEKRDIEMDVMFKRFILSNIGVASLYFFPQILSAVVFTVYIGSGHVLDISTTYTVMTIFNNLRVRQILESN
jgi:ATP-binding cassette, subfamily C (CFTR/MRP), member 1